MKTLQRNKQGFIERFDGDLAVIYQADRSTIRINRSDLPKEAKEGFFVVETDQPNVFVIDYVITEKRKQEIRRMSEYYYG